MLTVCSAVVDVVMVRRFVQEFPPLVETSRVAVWPVYCWNALLNFRLRGAASILIGGDQSSVSKGPEPEPALSESAAAAVPVPPVRLARPHTSLSFQTLLAFDALFTIDKPVIFAFHGYPTLIHRLAYRRSNHDNLHVHGYQEEGTTTTPFDMTVRNELDRFHLAMAAIKRVPRLEAQAIRVRDAMTDKLAEHASYIVTHGEDMPEIRNWQWQNP